MRLSLSLGKTEIAPDLVVRSSVLVRLLVRSREVLQEGGIREDICRRFQAFRDAMLYPDFHSLGHAVEQLEELASYSLHHCRVLETGAHPARTVVRKGPTKT